MNTKPKQLNVTETKHCYGVCYDNEQGERCVYRVFEHPFSAYKFTRHSPRDRVEEITAYRVDGQWLAPIEIVKPNELDLKRLEEFERATEIKKKLDSLNLTDKDLEIFQEHFKLNP